MLLLGERDPKDKERKAAEYAVELKKQMDDMQMSKQQLQQQHHQGGGGILSIGQTRQGRDIQRSHQAEYASYLDGQMNFKRNNQNAGSSGSSNDPYAAIPLDYSSSDHTTTNNNTNTNNNNNTNNSTNNSTNNTTNNNTSSQQSVDRRAKQQEYARQLQQQQQGKLSNQIQSSSSHLGAAPRVEQGWVIGPLGLPVRKTLEVGNRGVQKAFMQQMGGGSPNKPIDNNFHFQVDTKPYSIPQQQQQQQSPMSLGPLSPVAAAFTDIMDERAAKNKLLQLEQAKALEKQIEDNKSRQLQEKKKREEEGGLSLHSSYQYIIIIIIITTISSISIISIIISSSSSIISIIIIIIYSSL